jgi:hypothetical protein
MTCGNVLMRNYMTTMQCKNAFEAMFKAKLENFVDPLDGFDLEKFARHIKTPEDIPMPVYLQSKYGEEAGDLVRYILFN